MSRTGGWHCHPPVLFRTNENVQKPVVKPEKAKNPAKQNGSSALRDEKNQANSALVFIFFEKFVNLVGRRLYAGNGYIMIQRINNGCQEFTHVCFLIIRTGKQFLWTIIEVRGYDLADVTFFIVFVEFFQSVCEKTESCADKDTACFTFF